MTFFNISLNITIHIHPKKTPHNTSNLHKNAPLPLLTWQRTFCFGRSLSNYVGLVVKNTFKYEKKTMVDIHIRRYIQKFITTRPS